MTKRGNGEGSVYRRKDGKWVAAITLPSYINGKKKYHYGKTRKECVAWLDKFRSDLSKGNYSQNADTPLIEWLHTWFNDYCINIRLSTKMNYDTYINRHIKNSDIANMPLFKINTAILQTFFNSLYENGRLDGCGGLSAKTIRNIYNMLHKALKQAVGNQIIMKNFSEYVVLPKVIHKNIRVLDLNEQEQLIEACKNEEWALSVQIALNTGIRIGELLALRHSDFKKSGDIYYLDISKSLQRVKDYSDNSDGNSTILHESSTKTENSKRQIPVSDKLADAIINHISLQNEQAKKSYNLYNNNPYIVCNEIGNCIDPTTYRKWFRKITKRAKLTGHITPHTLRHSCASTAQKFGMNIKDISDILGHYSTDFTARTYIHTDLEGKYNAINLLHKNIKQQEEKHEFTKKLS